MKKIILFLMLIAISACGQKNEQDYSSINSPHYPDGVDTSVGIGRMLESAQVAYETGTLDRYLDTTGIVVMINGSRAGQCTGTLVAPDVVATNSHCLPDYYDSKNCSDLIGFKTAKGEKAVCKNVIYDSGNGEGMPDYAFFRLNRTINVVPAPISNSGIFEDQKVDIYSVDPASYGVGGVLRHKTCKAVYGSFVIPEGNDYRSERTFLTGDYGCRVIHGNSGSAIWANGSVVGVLFANFDPSNLSRHAPAMPQVEIDNKIRTHHFAAASNFACVSIPGLGLAQNPECSSYVKKNIADEIAKMDSDQDLFLKWIVDSTNKTHFDLPDMFYYSGVLQGTARGRIKVKFEPRCLNPEQEFVANASKKRLLAKPLQYKGVYVYPEFDVTPKLGIDEWTRIGIKLGNEKSYDTLKQYFLEQNEFQKVIKDKTQTHAEVVNNKFLSANLKLAVCAKGAPLVEVSLPK